MEYGSLILYISRMSSQQQLSLRSDNVSIPMLLFTKNIKPYSIYAFLAQGLIARYPNTQ